MTVDKDGLYTINGVALKTNDKPTIIEALLKITEPGDAKQKIVLLADAKTDYQSVIVALDALSSLGLSNVSMKTVIPQ